MEKAPGAAPFSSRRSWKSTHSQEGMNGTPQQEEGTSTGGVGEAQQQIEADEDTNASATKKASSEGLLPVLAGSDAEQVDAQTKSIEAAIAELANREQALSEGFGAARKFGSLYAGTKKHLVRSRAQSDKTYSQTRKGNATPPLILSPIKDPGKNSHSQKRNMGSVDVFPFLGGSQQGKEKQLIDSTLLGSTSEAALHHSSLIAAPAASYSSRQRPAALNQPDYSDAATQRRRALSLIATSPVMPSGGLPLTIQNGRRQQGTTSARRPKQHRSLPRDVGGGGCRPDRSRSPAVAAGRAQRRRGSAGQAVAPLALLTAEQARALLPLPAPAVVAGPFLAPNKSSMVVVAGTGNFGTAPHDDGGSNSTRKEEKITSSDNHSSSKHNSRSRSRSRSSKSIPLVGMSIISGYPTALAGSKVHQHTGRKR